jgi:hypothetical protein
MYMRIAIFLTLVFSAGAAFAAWQFQPKIADGLQAAVSQVPPELIEAALSEGAEPVEPVDQAKPYMPAPEVEALIREGNKRMREGNILGARRSYQDALAFGDVAAALVMGRSYDPIYFAKIVEPNAGPEPDKALEWYQRALVAGALQTAKVRIADLKHFMNKESASR